MLASRLRQCRHKPNPGQKLNANGTHPASANTIIYLDIQVLYHIPVNDTIKGMDEKILQEGYRQAEAITKQYAKTFYSASRFFTNKQKQAAYAVYALCRLSDNSVDDAAGEAARRNLQNAKNRITAAYGQEQTADPLVLAFRHAICSCAIPKNYFDEMVSGMEMDLEKNRYKNFEELYEYCYKVAGVIGLIMLKIFGYHDEHALQYAIDLGVALQLTNITRDIAEDYTRGRIYIPEDEMRKFGVTQEHIAQHRLDSNVTALLAFQIKRARQYYSDADQGIALVTARRSRLVILAIKEMYSKILSTIEKNGYDIFNSRAQVSASTKIFTLLKILLQGRYL